MSDAKQIGFPNIQFQNAQNSPPPKPPKPKGRLLIGGIFLALCGFIAYSVWDAFLRHSAYGVVKGNVVEVSPPYEGVLVSLLVKKGDYVNQGDAIAIVENIDLKNEYESSKEELAFAAIQIDAYLSKLKLDYAFQLDQTNGALIRHYELISTKAQMLGRLAELKDRTARANLLIRANAVAVEEIVALRAQLAAQYRKLEEIQNSIDASKERLDKLQKTYAKNAIMKSWAEQLRPFKLKIQHASAEIERVKSKIKLGTIASPISGTILKSHKRVGERCLSTTSLFSIIEEGSVYVTLYVTQENTYDFKLGDQVELYSPVGDVTCEVTKIGDRYEPAPASIKRFYKISQHLLPVDLVPNEEYDLRYGATVKLPYWRAEE